MDLQANNYKTEVINVIGMLRSIKENENDEERLKKENNRTTSNEKQNTWNENTLKRIKGRLNTAKKTISELEHVAINTIQSEVQKKKHTEKN